jgi:hypothetical protein
MPNVPAPPLAHVCTQVSAYVLPRAGAPLSDPEAADTAVLQAEVVSVLERLRPKLLLLWDHYMEVQAKQERRERSSANGSASGAATADLRAASTTSSRHPAPSAHSVGMFSSAPSFMSEAPSRAHSHVAPGPAALGEALAERERVRTAAECAPEERGGLLVPSTATHNENARRRYRCAPTPPPARAFALFVRHLLHAAMLPFWRRSTSLGMSCLHGWPNATRPRRGLLPRPSPLPPSDNAQPRANGCPPAPPRPRPTGRGDDARDVPEVLL